MNFDSFLTKCIGEFGLYQKFVVFLLVIPGCLMNSYNMFVIVFLAYTPEHRCRQYLGDNIYESNATLSGGSISECRFLSHDLLNASAASRSNGSLNYNSNHEQTRSVFSSACPFGHVYSRQYFESTLVTDFQLLCDGEIYVTVMMSVLGVCSVVGCTLIAWISDRFGRRKAFLVANSLYIFSSLASLLSPNILAFTALRSFSALTTIAGWNLCYTWAMEYVGPSKRTLTSTIFCLSFTVGSMSLGLLAYLCSTWIQLGIATSAPFLLTFSYYFLIMESPRWLLSHGRHKEAAIVLQKMAAWNGVPLKQETLDCLLNDASADKELEMTNPLTSELAFSHLSDSPTVNKNCGDTDTLTANGGHEKQKTGANVHPMQLFTSGPNLRRKTIIISCCWIANAVGYLTIAYNIDNLGGNFYLTYVIQASMEAPATLLNLVTLNRFGRIWPLFAGMVLSGISCLLTAPGETVFPSWLIIAFAALSKFGVSSSLDALHQLASELYPTTVRSLGIGFSSTVAELGTVLMPYIVLSSAAYKMLPMIILGLLSVLSGSFVLFLPETLNKPMPQTLSDSERKSKVGWKTFKDNFHRLRRS